VRVPQGGVVGDSRAARRGAREATDGRLAWWHGVPRGSSFSAAWWSRSRSAPWRSWCWPTPPPS